jgi:hypothetical protein
MDTNYIKSDGFSNPDTQRYFVENWPDERFCKESDERKCCGFCLYGHFLEFTDYFWVICLNPDSPYCYETLDGSFSCPVQDPYPADDDDNGDDDGDGENPEPPAGPPPGPQQTASP